MFLIKLVVVGDGPLPELVRFVEKSFHMLVTNMFHPALTYSCLHVQPLWEKQR